MGGAIKKQERGSDEALLHKQAAKKSGQRNATLLDEKEEKQKI